MIPEDEEKYIVEEMSQLTEEQQNKVLAKGPREMKEMIKENTDIDKVVPDESDEIEDVFDDVDTEGESLTDLLPSFDDFF
jgi:polyhydroxyalkanoate synthesis regulator phasin